MNVVGGAHLDIFPTGLPIAQIRHMMSAMAVPVLSVRRSDQARKPSVMFNPDDRTVVRHTKAGVWDIYNDISGFTRRKLFRLPFLSKVKAIKEAYQGRAHVLRMVHDITTLENCALYFVAWTVLKFVSAFMPAVALWYTGQLLRLVSLPAERTIVLVSNLPMGCPRRLRLL